MVFTAISLINQSVKNKPSLIIHRNECALEINIDFAKVFDNVDHEILLNKLENFEIRGVQLICFKSYFGQRLKKLSIVMEPFLHSKL